MKKNRSLKGYRLYVSNIMGIRKIEIVSQGNVIEAEGPNEVGKTSLGAAVHSVFSGARDLEILRGGAKKGEIVFEFPDGLMLRKVITAEKTIHSVVAPDGTAVKKKAAYISEHFDSLGFNPVDLLSEKGPEGKRRRLSLFQEALPMKVSYEQLQEIVPPKMEEHIGDVDGHAMPVIESLKKALTLERQGINRDKKTKEGAVSEIQAEEAESPPPGFGSWPDAVAYYHDEVDQLKGERYTAETECRFQVQEELSEIQGQLDDGLTRLQQEENLLREEMAVVRREAESRGAEGIAKIAQDSADQIAASKLRLGDAQARKDAWTKNVGLKETAKKFREEIETLEQDSRDFTGALQLLEELKEELTKEIPIPGVTISDDICVDNHEGYPVPWGLVNTGKRIEVAVALAEMRGPFIVVDGLESLDRDIYAALVARLRKSPDHFCILTRRRDDIKTLRIKS